MIYQVGGCVRDVIMGRVPKDYDYVVVGFTEQKMLECGFTKVGADFPVFLHPETKEEYALARTERKTGKGYHGFETYFGKEVTLEQDLSRRDFTINAMAYSRETGIVDPFNGVADIEARLIRHVNTDAFIEDPVRILRAARFSARYNFQIHPETESLIRSIDLDDIYSVPVERVLLEFKKALDDKKGFEFLEILYGFGEMIFEEFFGCDFDYRFRYVQKIYDYIGFDEALCVIAENSGGFEFLKRCKVKDSTLHFLRLIVKYSGYNTFKFPETLYNMITESDYFRRPEVLKNLVLYIDAKHVDILEIAAKMAEITSKNVHPSFVGKEIGEELKELRKDEFNKFFNNRGESS